MKRLILLFTIFITSLLDSYSQIGFSLHSGVVGQRQNMHLEVLGFSVTAYRFYLDYLGWADRVKTWEGNKSNSFHFGYQVPVVSWFWVTPLVGYSYNRSSGTRELSWGSGKGLYSVVIPGHKSFGFDYGAQVIFKIRTSDTVNLNLSGTLTRYCSYCGIGFEIKL